LKLKKFKGITIEDIQKVVETNNKKRYTLKYENNLWYIKANQGHSIKVSY